MSERGDFSGCIGDIFLCRNFYHYVLTGFFYCKCEEQVWIYSISSGVAVECKACGRKYNVKEPVFEIVLGGER